MQAVPANTKPPKKPSKKVGDELSPHYLSTVETGKRDPSVSTIMSIAKALGVAPVRELPPSGAEAGRLFDTEPDELQDAVLRILRAVSRRRR